MRKPIHLYAALAVVIGIVAGWSGVGWARQVPGFELRDPPGVAEKTYGKIPRTVPSAGAAGPPTYEECELSTTDYCDSFKLTFKPRRPNGHVTHLALTWGPTPSGARLDFILWNVKAKEECPPPDPQDPNSITAARFCGAEGRNIGVNYPKTVDLYDLPEGDYVMHVMNMSGSHNFYNLRGEVELIAIDPPRRRATPAPTKPSAATTRQATPKPTPLPAEPPLPTPSPERFPTPGPDGPLADMEIPLVVAGRQANPIDDGGSLVGRVLMILAIVGVVGGGGAAVFLKIRRDRV